MTMKTMFETIAAAKLPINEDGTMIFFWYQEALAILLGWYYCNWD